MQLNMLVAMNIYVNVVEQGELIRAAEVLELHRPLLPAPFRIWNMIWALSSCIVQHETGHQYDG